MVLNITDGVVTDSPYQNVDLHGWAARREVVAAPTTGRCCCTTSSCRSTAARPSTSRRDPTGCPNPDQRCSPTSSELPAYAVTAAENKGYQIEPGARGLVFNAGLDNLAELLDLGTPQQAKED